MLEIHTEIAHHPVELREELVELARVAFFITAQRLILLVILANPVHYLLLLSCRIFPNILANLNLRCKQWKNRQLVHRLVGNVALCVED